MTTTIKASCPACGDVELTPVDILLMVCSRDAGEPLSYYSFRCPSCTEDVRKPADESVVTLLISGGVQLTEWDVPAEALEPHPGLTLTYDDLLDFALRLGADDLLAAAAAAPARS